MEFNVADAKRWHEDGLAILEFKGKLDNKVANKFYSVDFENIYYGYAKSKCADEILEACTKLAKGVSNLSDNNQKEIVRNFISTTKIAAKDIQSFWLLLKKNGWLPVDPAEERRRAEEAIRIRREKAEAERRAKAAREAREREEWEKRLREAAERARQARMRVVKWVCGVAAAVLLGFVLFAGIPSYKYHHSEYKALLHNAEEFLSQNRYNEAIAALEEARVRKSSRKKQAEITKQISQVCADRTKKVAELRNEIKNVWNAYFVNGSRQLNYKNIKYVEKKDVLPVIKNVQERIDLLKSITADTDEYADNTQRLQLLKKYFNC